jgi:hypothetical protein
MVDKIANKDASQYVNRCESFNGNNTKGARYNDNLYVVYSYGHHFPMYVYDYTTRQWYANSDKYSQTTSKHQTQCRPSYEIAREFNREDLINLIDRGSLAEWVKWKAVA